MQQLRAELDKAQQLRAEAKDPAAQHTLEGVILALGYAIDGGGSPAEIAAARRTEQPVEASKPKAAPKSKKGAK